MIFKRDNKNIIYPDGAEFAFTILDDTDDTRVSNGKPVYDLLKEFGIRTTKTVWSFDTAPENRGPYFAGETLSSPEYLHWVRQLNDDGFEIAFHNATMGSSIRNDTVKAIEYLEKEFGKPVRLHCNHGQNRENLYWGADRYSTPELRFMFRLIARIKSNPAYEGNDQKSPYYWADIADKKLSYIRAFAFRRLNGLDIPPGRPYKDPQKQLTPFFFNTADAPDVKAFNRLVNPVTIEKLRREKGWAIISTHLGKGFFWKNKIDHDFKRTIRYLASLSGWYVPVSQLLDCVANQSGAVDISKFERTRMEYGHVLDRVRGKIFDSPFYQ